MIFFLQVAHKVYITFKFHDDGPKLVHLELFRRNTSECRMKILHKSIDGFVILGKIMSFLYAGTIVLFLLAPIYFYLFKDELILIYALHLPFINPKTKFVYGLNLGTQLFYISYGLIGLIGNNLAKI